MPKVELKNYEGREHSFVKHCLLESYLPELIYRVGQKWDSIVYVDGFAGPWKTKHPNYADSSFGIAIDALRACQDGLRMRFQRELQIESILVEQRKEAYSHLKVFAEKKKSPGFGVHALTGEFVDTIPEIDRLIAERTQKPFRFVFLDPTGWSQIPMRHLQPFLRNRSCEVLINLMTSHIVRFLDEPDRAESYNDLFGRNEVLDILHQTPTNERTDRAVQEYCLSLTLLCNFKYVSTAVILDSTEERIKYFLIYATNHPQGIRVFKAAEVKAARIQDELRYEAQIRKTSQPDLLFDPAPPKSRLSLKLRDRYLKQARRRILLMLSSKPKLSEISYADVFCLAMAFPLVTPGDLRLWLEDLKPNIVVDFSPRLRARPLEDYRIKIVKPHVIADFLD